MIQDRFGRTCALLLAVAALTGDALLLRATVSNEGMSLLHGVWRDAMFFSDLSNLLVAIVFVAIGLGLLRSGRPWWLGLALLCILLTCLGSNGWRGVVRPFSGNTLVHTWVPLAVALWCLVFTTKGRLRWRYVFGWSLVPIGYLAYVFVRGAVTKVYPYAWMNPAKVSGAGLAQSVAYQVVSFVVLATLLVATDRLWSRRRGVVDGAGDVGTPSRS